MSGQSTTSGEPTRGRCPQPHPHINNYSLITGASHPFYCSYNLSLTLPQGHLGFSTFSSCKIFKKGLNVFKNFSNLRAKGFSGPHPSQYFRGLRDCNLQNGHLSFNGFNFQGYSKSSSLSCDRGPFKGIKNPKFNSPRSKFFQSFEGAQGSQSSQGPQGLKGLILGCLHLSIHLCTAFYS